MEIAILLDSTSFYTTVPVGLGFSHIEESWQEVEVNMYKTKVVEKLSYAWNWCRSIYKKFRKAGVI